MLRAWLLAAAPLSYAQGIQPQSIEEIEGDEESAAAPATKADALEDAAGPNGWNGLFGIAEAQATNGILRAAIRIAGTELSGVTFASIKRNITQPWAMLDQSLCRTNMLGHPYQGVFYFHAARSSNWPFYASTMNAVLGSIVWDLQASGRAHP